jgi:glycosyltransferase involved in cell wall biosynthesis
MKAPGERLTGRESATGSQSASARYNQVLVSPLIGGGARLALAIHDYVSRQRPGRSRLIIPQGGEAQALAVSERLPFVGYNLERLQGSRRFGTLYECLRLLLHMPPYCNGVVHVHSPMVYGALLPFLRLSRCKTVVHVHLDYKEDELRWPLRVPPDLVLVCAEFIKPTVEKVLGASAVDRTKLVVLQNAVDTDRFFPMDREQAKRDRGVSAARTVLLMTANLAPHKGQDTAIRALSSVKKRGHRPLLWLLGEERDGLGEYTRYLKDLAKQLGVAELVEFLGFTSDVPQLLHAADFLLLPSTREGLPLAVLEAQASKVAVLAAPTAGVPEVIEDGRTGFLIPADDVEGYAAAMISLIEDPQMASRVVDAAFRQVSSRFTLNHYCARVIEEYDSLTVQ